MKIYTIIGGVNGVGKSSLTGVLKNRMDDLGFVVDVDKITEKLGKTPAEGGKAAIKIINESLSKGVSFSQETTLSGYRTVKTAKIARSSGYYVRMFYVGLDTLEECLRRIKNRVDKGGHDISHEDVVRRFNRRIMSLRHILPYCNEATLFDNENGFVPVAEYRNGEIVTLTELSPKWLMQLQLELSKNTQM